MRKFIFLVACLFSGVSYASHNDIALKAVDVLAECLPSVDFSCLATGTCHASLCSKCKQITKASSKSCPDKQLAYSAWEGFVGSPEGSCQADCAEGSAYAKHRIQGEYAPGDKVIVAAQGAGEKHGAGFIFKEEKGAVQLGNLSYDGPAKETGASFEVSSYPVTSAVDSALSCLEGNTNKYLLQCLKNVPSCKGFLTKSSRCSICASTSECSSETASFIGAMFNLSTALCSGC